MILPVVMAGGSGTRLWPLSRQLKPKQFLTLVDDDLSMLQTTIRRLDGLEHSPPVLICNENHRFIAAEQLRQLGLDEINIILEPEGRNTAPAIALAALQASTGRNDPVMLVMAADHLIQDVDAFQESIKLGLFLAESGKLVTFGVKPAYPETGYGYLKAGEAVKGGFKVDCFVEKPDIDTAKAYLAGGDYFWNSGMFMFRASRYLQELEKFTPQLLSICREAMSSGVQDMSFTRVDNSIFSSCPDISIDYAVMEKTDDAVMVLLDSGWSDIGSWSALFDAGVKSADGNIFKGDVVAHKTSACYVHSTHRLVSTLGLSNIIIVETKDAVLVAHKDHVQSVKFIVDELKVSHRSEHISHREVYRPWGVYESIDSGERYQVKRITVKSGGKLSLQMHHHRAEHWIVVSGTAKVTNGDQTYLVTENQSTYIPVGQVHSLENPGTIPLELIEVQSGAYLGEDDIVRYEDVYGRIDK